MNKRLHLPSEQVAIDWPVDVAVLQQGLRSRGYVHSDAEVAQLWADYSEEFYCAGWMSVHSPQDADRLINAHGGETP